MIWVSELRAMPGKEMPGKEIMKRATLKVLFMLVLVSAVYARVNGPVEDTGVSETGKKKAFEPAGKFIPTEKLRADDAIAFPVDI
jgi:hypothetical protein